MARKQSSGRDRPTRHVVLRYNWRASNGRWALLPGLTRLASFSTAAEAEADRGARDETARRVVNPFRCGEWPALTSMPEGVFQDWLADLGLSLPELSEKNGVRDWVGWWERQPAEKRLRAWQAFDKLRFYTVQERPECPVGYVVVSLNWHYNDQWNYLNSEGGNIQAVYRTRAKAEAAAKKHRGWMDGARGHYFPSSADPLDPAAHFRVFENGLQEYDIVEVELEGIA